MLFTWSSDYQETNVDEEYLSRAWPRRPGRTSSRQSSLPTHIIHLFTPNMPSLCISRPPERHFLNIPRLGGDQVIPAFLESPVLDDSLFFASHHAFYPWISWSSMFLLLALAWLWLSTTGCCQPLWLICICLVDRTSYSFERILLVNQFCTKFHCIKLFIRASGLILTSDFFSSSFQKGKERQTWMMCFHNSLFWETCPSVKCVGISCLRYGWAEAQPDSCFLEHRHRGGQDSLTQYSCSTICA